MAWSPYDYRLLLRPCHGRYPHHLLQIEVDGYDDRFTVSCMNCGVEAGRLTPAQAQRIAEQNEKRLAA